MLSMPLSVTVNPAVRRGSEGVIGIIGLLVIGADVGVGGVIGLLVMGVGLLVVGNGGPSVLLVVDMPVAALLVGGSLGTEGGQQRSSASNIIVHMGSSAVNVGA
jgi:hypothetical protein